jgi:hypothetical protein
MHKQITKLPNPTLQDVYARDAVIEALAEQNAMLHQSLDRIWQELALFEFHSGIRGTDA